MSYVKGADLASILLHAGKLPVHRAIGIARQIAEGLQAAHEAGVVHRDLKPANVMVDSKDQVLIEDFGLARSAPVDSVPEDTAPITDTSGADLSGIPSATGTSRPVCTDSTSNGLMAKSWSEE
jgi:serine/threonine-protein kinase